jgi:uncharacterized membrane protein
MGGCQFRTNSSEEIVMEHIRNPVEWSWDQVRHTWRAAGSVGHAVLGANEYRHTSLAVRRIGIADLRDALARGFSDFGAFRTDVLFLCLFYPLAGFVLAYATFGYNLLPMLFPLISGFALIGPVAAVGLYEMSRRREQGLATNWANAFSVLGSPSFGAIAVLGLLLGVIFLAWLGAAWVIYYFTLGPEPPASNMSFIRDVFTTGAGWAMIVLGIGVGFLFAVLVLTISVVSFPLLLDRDVGLGTAMRTSVNAVKENPVTITVWGLIVAGSLVIGTIPLLLGLIIVVPVLGHATWHLYRKLVPR